MYGTPIDSERGFLHSLRQSRVGMTSARNVLCGGAELHCDRRLRDHVGGVRADDMDAQYAIGFGVGENFHEAVGLLIGLGATVGCERKFPYIVGDIGRFEFLLGLADAS